MNRENLEKLATYLESDDLKAEFSMRTYTSYVNSLIGEASRIKCGTIGCAIGHGPHARIPKKPYEGWEAYSYRVFEVSWLEWDFLFSAKWAGVDNTPQGAAKRINWLLEGLSIFNYMKQHVPEDSDIYKWIMDHEPKKS